MDTSDARRIETRDRTSRLPGFHLLPTPERRGALASEGWLSREAIELLARGGGSDEQTANALSENVLGVHGLPLAAGLNFRVNGHDRVAPMCVEEPSVVAAASNAARIALAGGGFFAEADEPLVAAQLQILDVPDAAFALRTLAEGADTILAEANAVIPAMVRRGGGARAIETRVLEQTSAGAMLVVHLLVDTRDAMGANVLNTLAEAMAAPIVARTGGRAGLRILTNLADRRCVRVRVRIPAQALATRTMDGARVRDGIVSASRFAELDRYRACTHNKGIMNGVDAVVVATGNDWRAVEAAAHTWASRDGTYRPLATWHATDDGSLEGRLEMPLALGIVGGAARAHPGVRVALQLADVSSATDLAMLAGAAGLASNLAALRALATDGIQRGHMALHARSVAAGAGAIGDEVDAVAAELSRIGDYGPAYAARVLQRIRLGLVVHEG